MLIGKSDKIEKLKELCQKISDVPQDKQILIYKGKILSNDKLIHDYNINDGDNIILKKKEDPSPVNNSLVPNFGISNIKDIFSNNNISLLNNKEINFSELSNMLKQIPDYLSFIQKMDVDKIDNLYQLIGLGSFSDILGIDPQKYKQIQKELESKEIMNNILNDPSLLEIGFNNPEIKQKFKKYPFIKLAFQYPQIFLSSQSLQKAQIYFKKDEKI